MGLDSGVTQPTIFIGRTWVVDELVKLQSSKRMEDGVFSESGSESMWMDLMDRRSKLDMFY